MSDVLPEIIHLGFWLNNKVAVLSIAKLLIKMFEGSNALEYFQTDDNLKINVDLSTYALKTELAYYQTKTTLDATLIVGTMYELGTLTGNISMALPTGTSRQRICVKFNCGATPYTFTLTGTNFTTFSLTPVANTCYDVEFEYNGATSKWTGYVNSYLA